MTFQEKNMTK